MTQQEQVFNQLVSDYSERLYWHVRRFGLSHEDTDDLLQDIFTKVWTALPTFRGDANLYTWVWRIATNETLNYLRKQKIRATLRLQDLDTLLENRIDNDPYFVGTDLERNLSKAIIKLPEKQRQVFIMRYFDDLSYEQIAEITGTSVGALKTSYHLARKKIEAFLQDF